jgi:ATP-binding cassette subfamily F protein uup
MALGAPCNVQRPNVLVLDEPSVDCDLNTLAALESYLNEFKGVLIIVSHDRAFGKYDSV